MKLTNNHNIPPALYDRIKEDVLNDPYDRDESSLSFRTTELLGPPLPVTLFNKHRDSDELVVDASHFLTLLFGTVFHELCEGESSEDILYEKKVSRSFEYKGNMYWVHGTVDEIELIETLLLTDNKTCLITNLGYDKTDYEDQLNVYKHLLGRDIDTEGGKLRIRYFIKDLTASKRDSELSRCSQGSPAWYKAQQIPACAIHYVDVPVYSEDRIKELIMDRIADHIDNPERPCTATERWDRAPKHAVMLTGNKTAKRLLSTAEEAQQYIAIQLKPKDQNRSFIELRQPAAYQRDMRCQYYCQVKSVCPYAKSKGYK